MGTIISQLDNQWIGLLLLFVATILDVVDYYRRGKEKRKGFLSLENVWMRRIARYAFFMGTLYFITAHFAQIPQNTSTSLYIANILFTSLINAALEVVVYVVLTIISVAIYHLVKWTWKGIKALFSWLTE